MNTNNRTKTTKTNYAEQLAWFEYHIKPYVVTDVTDNYSSRCWHSTRNRSPPSYNRLRESSIYNRQDPPVSLSNPRKRPRVESSSPFLTNMQDDQDVSNSDLEEEELDDHISILDSAPPSSPSLRLLDSDEVISFDNEFDDMSLSTQEKSLTTSDHGKLSRTISEQSFYYDAQDDFTTDNNVRELPEEEEDLLLPVSTVRQQATSLYSIVTEEAKAIERKNMEIFLNTNFQCQSFMPNQLEAINAALNNENILLVMPSGPSRNICLQFPTIYQHRASSSITIILVPSLPYQLQQDDYMLDIHNIPSLFVTKSNTTHKKNWISTHNLTTQYVANTKLLYIMYDEFLTCKPFFRELYKNDSISRFVLDEAHCLSKWGEDFHFGYFQAAKYIMKKFSNIPISIFTAIPNDRIHIDIITSSLSLQHCKIFKKSILM